MKSQRITKITVLHSPGLQSAVPVLEKGPVHQGDVFFVG